MFRLGEVAFVDGFRGVDGLDFGEDVGCGEDEVAIDDLACGDIGLSAMNEDAGGVVVSGLDAFEVDTGVLSGAKLQFVCNRGDQKFLIGDEEEVDGERSEEHGTCDAVGGDSGGEDGVQLPLFDEGPQDEHGGEAGDDASDGVEEDAALVGVILNDVEKDLGDFCSIARELVDITEGVDDHEQPHQRDERDEVGVPVSPEEVTVEEGEHEWKGPEFVNRKKHGSQSRGTRVSLFEGLADKPPVAHDTQRLTWNNANWGFWSRGVGVACDLVGASKLRNFVIFGFRGGKFCSGVDITVFRFDPASPFEDAVFTVIV